MDESFMKETLKKKLNNVKDLEQRKALKELVDEVLMPMAEYQEERWEELLNRVADEVQPSDEPHEIVTGLCGKDEYDPAHSYLFPILPPEKPNLSDIEAALKATGETRAPIRLFSVYINETWEKALGILTDSPVFDVTLLTAGGASVSGTCLLVPDERYKEVLRDVYRSFIKNGLSWNTVCTAYTDRMASIELTEWESFPEDAVLSEIHVNFKDFADTFVTDMVPLWNIARSEMKSINFALPVEDGLTFEHRIGIDESEIAHGYIVNTNDESVRSVRREHARLIVTTDTKKSRMWEIYKIVCPQGSQTDMRLPYPLFSNRRRRLFIDMFAERARNIFTYAEAMRILSSYDLPVTALDLEATSEELPPHTHGTMNFDLDGGFTHINTAKTLCVFFEADGKEEYAQDIIRFLMSELQMHFPVYRCAGLLK
jgi:hypothetical protein